MKYMVKAKKIVTVSSLGSLDHGAMVIEDGKIYAIGTWQDLQKQFSNLEVFDYSDYVITPSLVDCHTHLLEFAPTSLYPVSAETHFWAGRTLIFKALSAGITALGEQICGHPLSNFTVADYRKAVEDLPIDISFATTSISIGLEKLVHFSALTGSKAIEQSDLSDADLVRKIAAASDYPGENIFINATPANFKEKDVPRAGEIMYTLEQLQEIVASYHQNGKKIGCHVGGEQGIEMALEAGIDVLHHAHGITDELIGKAAAKQVPIVATPMGGTHLMPNSPEEIANFLENKIKVSISTDCYLPPHPDATWLPFTDQQLKGPDVLMAVAQPSMQLLKKRGYNENEILALLTNNPADLLGKADRFGRLEPGMDANFLVAEGVPGLEIVAVDQIKRVYFRGIKVINRG